MKGNKTMPLYPNYNGYNMHNNLNNLTSQYYQFQNMRDEIDKNMQQIQQTMNQQQNVPQQVPQVNQTFQLAPNNYSREIDAKVVKDIEEVKGILVNKLGIFVNEGYSKLWIKDDYGKIREFDTSEVIEIDEKDRTIIEMQQKLDEKDKAMFYMRQELDQLREEIESNDANKSTGVDTKSNATSTKQKSTGVSKSK